MEGDLEDELLRPIHLKLPPENIVVLKFIIESYEGIAEVRTLDAKRGEIVLLALADTVLVVEDVLVELESELGVVRVDSGACMDGDWLLSEV